VREAFDKLRLNKTNKILLQQINAIIENYSKQGYRLTLRQLYYQLVSRDVIPNRKNEYTKLSSLLNKARLAGIVDWDAIEDRLRVPRIPYSADDIADALEDIQSQYRLNRMRNQDIYLEVWSEKDALSGIFARVTEEYHIRLAINRGYASVTAMYNAYNRFKAQIEDGKKCYILYFGDHDPSGLDMIRDITDRLVRFIAIGLKEEFVEWCNKEGEYYEEDEDGNILDIELVSESFKRWLKQYFEVVPVGLTMSQINRYSPPPNPAKEADPRGDWYKAYLRQKHGLNQFISWEVDALPPEVLTSLLSSAIESKIDRAKFEEILKSEKSDKVEFGKLIKKYSKGK
jgi:hypothetical protein